MKRSLLMAMILLVLPIGCAISKYLPVDVDYAQFRISSDSTLWEMYFSFPDTAMNYYNIDGNETGKLNFTAHIAGLKDTFEVQQWSVIYQNPNPINQHILNLFGQKSFVLAEGIYKVNLTIKDEYDMHSFAQNDFLIDIKKYDSTIISISDLELAHSIQNYSDSLPVDYENFRKLDYVILPNPSKEFLADTPLVCTYMEIYNTQLADKDSIRIRYSFLNALKNLSAEFTFRVKAGNDFIYDMRNLLLPEIMSGVYYLVATVIYEKDQKIDSVSTMKKLYLINPNKNNSLVSYYTENSLFEKSEFSALSESQVLVEFDKASTVATNNEIELFEKLTSLEAKQKFLFRFWLRRDPDTTTYYNEFLDEYRERIKYATIYFSVGLGNEGWKTERGRVLLKYGQPTKRDYHPQNGDLRAYEVWTFDNIQGGAEFVFVDMVGSSIFILVHSTASGYRQNEYWYDEYVVSHSGDSNNKRMEKSRTK